MILDYTCPHCGAKETYELVPMQHEGEPEAPSREPRELDFTCARCGATDTFQLVRKTAATA
jgi:hypothetical protein